MKAAPVVSVATEINRLHEQAKALCEQSRENLNAGLAAAWQAGHLLIAEKQRVRRRMGPGAWLLWVEANFHGTPRTAQRYMRLAQSVGDVSFLRGMSLRQAYARLGIAMEPKTPSKCPLVHKLPAHVVLANRLLRTLKYGRGKVGVEQGEAYRCDLRPLFEQLRAWFEPPTAIKAANFSPAARSYRL